VRGFLKYGSYRLLGALVGPLPPRIGYGIARPASWLLYALSPTIRHNVTHNMSHVLGLEASDERVRASVRRVCLNIAKGHYELFRLSRLSIDEIQAITRIEGKEYMEQALSRGKGVIVAGAHLGNVDVVMQLPAVYHVRFVAPTQHIQPERLFQYVQRLRQRYGMRLLPSDGPMMEVIRALKRGEIVGLACDWAIADNRRQVDFFGSPAWLPEGPVRLALRTGAPLLPAFCLRLPDNTFLLRIEPALELPQTGDSEADVAAGMEMVLEVLERHISERPEQWLMISPVWQTN
jgi:lauroyl/myristoyl acyltransferase